MHNIINNHDHKLILVDTHAHLDDHIYESNLEQVLAKAKDNNIAAIIIPSTTLDNAPKIFDLIEKFNKMSIYPKLFAMVGVHPHDASTWQLSSEKLLLKLLNHEYCVGIGEIGLDYYYNFSDKKSQKTAFLAQLEIAKLTKSPISVHVRNAFDDFFEIIDSSKITSHNIILHCFTGSLEYARIALRYNFKFSIGGILTFPKSEDIRNVYKNLPIENIILETDSPYLTPHPLRGKINEPANLIYIYQKLVEIKQNILYNHPLFQQINLNVLQLFPKIRNLLTSLENS